MENSALHVRAVVLDVTPSTVLAFCLPAILARLAQFHCLFSSYWLCQFGSSCYRLFCYPPVTSTHLLTQSLLDSESLLLCFSYLLSLKHNLKIITIHKYNHKYSQQLSEMCVCLCSVCSCLPGCHCLKLFEMSNTS